MKPRQLILGPDDPRNPARRTKHGLTPDEQDALIAMQGGLCIVCRMPGRGPLELDHDHRHCPGREGCRQCVSGALCGRCNRAVWQINDDPEVADRLAAYLRRTR